MMFSDAPLVTWRRCGEGNKGTELWGISSGAEQAFAPLCAKITTRDEAQCQHQSALHSCSLCGDDICLKILKAKYISDVMQAPPSLPRYLQTL